MMARDTSSNTPPGVAPTEPGKSQQETPYASVISQVVAKIEDQPILFAIAVIAFLVGLTVLGAGVGSPDVRFVAVVIALLAFLVLLANYGRAFFKPLPRAVVPTTSDSTRQRDQGQMQPLRSDATGPNPLLWVEERNQDISNIRWLEEYGYDYLKDGSLLLMGGTSSTDFRLRIAQACIRDDMTPSLWSHVAICTGQHNRNWILTEVSLEPESGFDVIRRRNAVHENRLDSYNNPRRWPNIAILSFPVHGHLVLDSIWELANNRGIVDFMELVMPWLAAVNGTNTFPEGKGIPSAVFAMTVMQRAGLEFPPGFSPRAGYPETLWQLAKWWYRFYEERAGGQEPPKGKYILRQPAAAIVQP